MDKELLRTCNTHGQTMFVLEGRGYYRCKRCRQDRVAEQRRKNKQKLVEEFGGRCVICGYDRYAGALQFHHIDPSKKSFGIAASGMSRGIDRLREEALKCILVCGNCHAEIENGITLIPEWANGKPAPC